MCSYDTTTDDRNFPFRNARNTAEKYARSTFALSQEVGSDLDSHPSSDLTHRYQEWQLSILIADSFVSQTGCLSTCHSICKLRSGSHVQVGKEQEVITQESIFSCQRFFDLDHQLSCPSFCSSRDDFCTLLLVVCICKTRSQPSICLNQNFMAFTNEAMNTSWCQSDTIFIVFDFFWNTD